MKRARKHLLYGFFDAEGRPFYVGRTINFLARRRFHHYRARYGDGHPKYRRLAEVLQAGILLRDAIRPVSKGVDGVDIRRREKGLVAYYKRKGYNLTNLTLGGEGGFEWTEDARNKLSRLRKGRRHSSETCKRISAARKGMRFSKKHRKNLSVSRRRRVTTDETREKMRKTMKGRINIKHFLVRAPDGTQYTTKRGLTFFCEEHGLQRALMSKVASGERQHHKGWACCRIEGNYE